MNDQIKYYENKLHYEIDSWDLNKALKENKNIVVIDTRSSEAYAREHITCAINIPHRTITESGVSGLDKTTLYVTYCDGIGCNASTRGALNLAKLGFSVRELLGGIDWWKRDGYETEGENIDYKQKGDCGC